MKFHDVTIAAVTVRNCNIITYQGNVVVDRLRGIAAPGTGRGASVPMRYLSWSEAGLRPSCVAVQRRLGRAAPEGMFFPLQNVTV